MKKTILFFAAILLFFAANAFENDLTSICKRPNSNEIYVGGEFKTIIVLDATSGKTLRQINIEKGIKDMQFSKDGKNLIVTDGYSLNFLNIETGESMRKFTGSGFRLFENSPYFIDADWTSSKSVKVYSTTDGSLVMEHKPSFTPLDAGFNADFTELIILGRSMDIKKEKNLIPTKTVKQEGYNIYNKAYVEQEADGKGSGFEVIDVKTKTSKLNVIIPYKTAKSFGLSISKYKKDYYLACWDMFLRVDEKGIAHPIETSDPEFAYATNRTNDGKSIFVASTKDGFIYNCETSRFSKFDTKDANEFSYSVDISEADGKVYLLAKDYSINILDATGMKLGKFKVDNSTGKGFGVYYYNGFTKKEDRDKESKIINNVLNTFKMKTIDLESDIGKSDFLLGIFKTQADAEKFKNGLTKLNLQYITKIAPVK